MRFCLPHQCQVSMTECQAKGAQREELFELPGPSGTQHPIHLRREPRALGAQFHPCRLPGKPWSPGLERSCLAETTRGWVSPRAQRTFLGGLPPAQPKGVLQL